MKKILIILALMVFGGGSLAPAADIVWLQVQHRTYGEGKNFNRLGFGLTDARGEYWRDGTGVREVKLFDPAGKALKLSKVAFASDVEIFGTYDAKNSQWRYTRTWQPESWFSATIAGALSPGVYVLKVVTRDGRAAESAFAFNRLVKLPIIDADTFRITGDPAGNLVWRWKIPGQLGPLSESHRMRARAAVDIYRKDRAVAYFSVILPVHMGFVFVPRRVVEALNRQGDRFEFKVALETRDKNNRTYSRPVVIRGKLPPAPGS